MIALDARTPQERALWAAILDLADGFTVPWTLIGAQMVFLHGCEAGRVPPRRSLDIDALVNIRVLPSATRTFAEALIAHGFDLDGASRDNIGHRFVRREVSIDVLAPDGAGARADRTTIPPAHTVSVPGGSQALTRTERVPVNLDGRKAAVPRPNLAGAILLKARAVDVDDAPNNQRQDLAFLCSLAQRPTVLSAELTAKERTWLLRRSELLEPNHPVWRSIPDGQDAHLAYRTLAGALR